jgi:hypothetical protein
MDNFKLHHIVWGGDVDPDNNDVIIKFVGFPNELASTLFINYVMLCVGFDYESIDSMPSTEIH